MPRCTSLGLWFNNYEQFESNFTYLSSCLRSSRRGLMELYPQLKSEKTSLYFDGVGRMELVAKRGVENFESMGREAWLVNDGEAPAPRHGDVFTSFSSSGEKKPIIVDVDLAKELGLVKLGVTSYDNSPLGKRVDYIGRIVGRGLGEQEIKKWMGSHTPLAVMGSGPETCSLAFIDCLSYGLAQSNNARSFIEKMEYALYQYIVYLGDVHRHLEKKPQQRILKRIINGLAFDVKDIDVTGFKYPTTVGKMFGIRLQHAIYTRGKRRAKTIDSTNFPKHIDVSTGLFAISQEGESEFTNFAVDAYLNAGCDVYGLTMREDSTFAKKIGPYNALTLPECEELPLNEESSVDPFNTAALIVTDCNAMEVMHCTGRTEKQAEAVHNPWR